MTSSISVAKLVPAAWLRIASEQAGRADHHHLPMTDRAALAILVLQQAAGFCIEPQQEARISRHLGFLGGSSVATRGWRRSACCGNSQ
jgi:hypothetical protein